MNWLRQWPPAWPDIDDPAVLAALAKVPRDRFVPPGQRNQAYEDIPLAIGQGQTISQPYIVALMTQALHLTRASRVLEIGTGSGYQAAILAQLTPHVWSVEILPELAGAAAARLDGLGYAVTTKVGDGRLGWPEEAPFDAIIVTAAAAEVPPVLASQLADRGRLVIPLGESQWEQILWLIERQRETYQATVLADVRFVPLVASSTEQTTDPELAEIRRRLKQAFHR